MTVDKMKTELEEFLGRPKTLQQAMDDCEEIIHYLNDFLCALEEDRKAELQSLNNEGPSES